MSNYYWLRKHFFKDKDRPICRSLVNARGVVGRECFCLRYNDQWYSCLAFGFRFDRAKAKGACRRAGLLKVLYDRDFLRNIKKTRYNFCSYRLLAPIILLSSLGLLSLIFFRAWPLIQALVPVSDVG